MKAPSDPVLRGHLIRLVKELRLEPDGTYYYNEEYVRVPSVKDVWETVAHVRTLPSANVRLTYLTSDGAVHALTLTRGVFADWVRPDSATVAKLRSIRSEYKEERE